MSSVDRKPAALSFNEMGSAVAHVEKVVAARRAARAVLESCVEPRSLTELDGLEQAAAELWRAGFLHLTDDGRLQVPGSTGETGG